MSILCDRDLIALLNEGLITDPDLSLVNPASIDIRVGRNAIREISHGRWECLNIPNDGLIVDPGEFILIDTWEKFHVPNGYVMDLRLKSSTARRGWNHSLAFFVDPGWNGHLTMEIQNLLQYNSLTLVPGQRFAQIIVYRLTGMADCPYSGKYQNATGVEGAKN